MSLGSVQILHKSLQEAKKSLDDTNEAIQKISGRDTRHSFQSDKGAASGGHMRAWSDDYLPPAKRRVGNDFRRPSKPIHEEEAFDDEFNKPTSEDNSTALKSSVSAAPVPPRPVSDPNTDTASKLRNRRMFGMLMGTLQKFQKDASQVSEQEKKRVEIETKLEQEAMKEREEAAQHKRQLLDQRKIQRQLVGKLASQLELAELYEEWNVHDRSLRGFIKTSSQPSIFYLPTKHNETTEELLKKCQINLEEIITSRQNEVKSLLQGGNDSSADNEQLEESIEVTEQSMVVDNDEKSNDAQSEH